jgi:hypothetical protein
MRSWKSLRLTSHTWLGLNPQIGRPLSRIVVPLVFLFYEMTGDEITRVEMTDEEIARSQRDRIKRYHLYRVVWDLQPIDAIANSSNLVCVFCEKAF